MLIDKLDNGLNTDDVYYSSKFINTLESSLQDIRINKTEILSFESRLSFVYRGDFYGLLNEIGIPKKYHYTILRINGYLNSRDFTQDIDRILVPVYSEIEILANALETY